MPQSMALSNDAGRVALDWEVITENTKPKLRMIWSGGRRSPVVVPVQRGFGSRLISAARDQLTAATVDFLPRGVVYTVICSLGDKS
jgi:two-component sensor histidine kinase